MILNGSKEAIDLSFGDLLLMNKAMAYSAYLDQIFIERYKVVRETWMLNVEEIPELPQPKIFLDDEFESIAFMILFFPHWNFEFVDYFFSKAKQSVIWREIIYSELFESNRIKNYIKSRRGLYPIGAKFGDSILFVKTNMKSVESLKLIKGEIIYEL